MTDVQSNPENPVQPTNAASEAIATPVAPQVTPATQPAKITIDDFAKIDLRIVMIVNAEEVPEAEKLLKLTVDLGGETRQIFAGIKSAYKPEELIGKMTVIVANLEPRKMRFGLSEGMVLVAVGPDRSGLWILEPQAGAQPGMKVQ